MALVSRLHATLLAAAAVLLVAPALAHAEGSWTYSSADGKTVSLQFATDSGASQDAALFTFSQNVQSISCPAGNGTVAPNQDPKQASCPVRSGATGQATVTTAAPIGCTEAVGYQARFPGVGFQPQTSLTANNNGNCPGSPPPDQCPANAPPGPHAPPALGTERDLNLRFVKAAYLDLLGRQATPTELKYFGNLLTTGTSRKQVALTLLGNSEYRTRFIGSLYQSLLRRAATPSDTQFWLQQLTNGAGRDDIRAEVLGSGEYFQRCARGDNHSFVSHLFQDLLGRQADAAAQSAFLNLLGNNVSRTQVAQQVEQSDEFRARVVTMDYQYFLRRSPDSAGLSSAVANLHAGGSEDTLIGLLMGSPEYLANEIGVPRVVSRFLLGNKGVIRANLLVPAVLQLDVLRVTGTQLPAVQKAAVITVPKTKRIGRVSFGKLRKGAHRLHWNRRVNGHRLKPGRYLIVPRALSKRGALIGQLDPVKLRVKRAR